MTPPINSVSDEEIARLAKKLRTKTERVHDLSGVGYIDDADCHRAANLLEALAARRAANTPVDGVVVDPATILAARDALLADNLNEAWHQLYTMADPTFTEMQPWRNLEHKAALPTSPALPSQVVGVSTFVLHDEIGEPDEWKSVHDELASWTGSAFLAGEKVDNEAELKGDLYNFLCKLLGYLACGEEVARYAANQSCLTSPAAEPVAWVTADILAAMKRGERAVPGWKRSDDFCIPLYAAHPAPSASREVTEADIESAAEAMWRAEVSEVGAARRAREAEYWADQSAETRDKWLRFARAALLAALPEREG